MEILSAKYLVSSPGLELCPPEDRPEYAFIGRSNVGKSSLINMLTRQSRLAKTSSSPGKTQMINHFLINQSWYLVDLPGYGYAKVSQSQRKAWKKMIWEYLENRRNLISVFVLIDSRLDPQRLDLDFLSRLGEAEIPFSLIFTKADKNNQRITHQNVKKFLRAMEEEWEFLPRAFVSSAVKFHGRKEILAYIDELNQEFADSLSLPPEDQSPEKGF